MHINIDFLYFCLLDCDSGNFISLLSYKRLQSKVTTIRWWKVSLRLWKEKNYKGGSSNQKMNFTNWLMSIWFSTMKS